MMIFLLLPVLLAATVAYWRTRSRIAVALLIAIAMAYASALTLLSIDPYFEDNGSIEFIAWRPRLILAMEVAGWLTILTFPLVLLGHAILVRLRSRTRR